VAAQVPGNLLKALAPAAQKGRGRAGAQTPEAATTIFKAHAHNSALGLAQGSGRVPGEGEQRGPGVLQQVFEFLDPRSLLVVGTLKVAHTRVGEGLEQKVSGPER
jgi:hypothetical protein